MAVNLDKTAQTCRFSIVSAQDGLVRDLVELVTIDKQYNLFAVVARSGGLHRVVFYIDYKGHRPQVGSIQALPGLNCASLALGQPAHSILRVVREREDCKRSTVDHDGEVRCLDIALHAVDRVLPLHIGLNLLILLELFIILKIFPINAQSAPG